MEVSKWKRVIGMMTYIMSSSIGKENKWR
jgi:hypothetical protein